MINSGKMTSVITIQQPTLPGPLGQEQWAEFATCRAERRSALGRGLNAEQMGGSELDTEFVIWYRPGINAKMRVTVAGESSIFPIKYVDPQPKDGPRELHIFCREVINA